MIKTITVLPGITLRCLRDDRFKQNLLSIQFYTPATRENIPANALLPEVLLRGCQGAEDLRKITLRLDDLYGAAVGPMVRRIGDYHSTGLSCGFIEDRFAMEPEGILAPMVAFLKQLFLCPLTEKGAFRADFVAGEKTNLIAAIEARRNDKRAYANGQLLRHMCRADSFGIPRLGDKEQVEAITPESLFAYYQKVLRTAPVELFYVGTGEPERIAGLVKDLFQDVDRDYVNLPVQTPYQPSPEGSYEEKMDVAQGKLCMGFVSPVTMRDPEFVAYQLLNLILGGGMTSKLFMQVREKMSLCYDISSGYHGSKGILTVSAGIDFDKKDLVQEQILAQLEACARGEITPEELAAARQAMRTGLLSTYDSPGAMESYYATSYLGGFGMDPREHMKKVEQVTAEEISAAAKKLRLHTVFFLKGEQ